MGTKRKRPRPQWEEIVQRLDEAEGQKRGLTITLEEVVKMLGLTYDEVEILIARELLPEPLSSLQDWEMASESAPYKPPTAYRRRLTLPRSQTYQAIRRLKYRWNRI